MPNAKCDKCGKYLDDICITKELRIKLVNCIKERSKKQFGIIYNIDPPIKHNDINPDNKDLNNAECDGYLNYHLFCRDPQNFDDVRELLKNL